MEKKILLTRILAITGTALVWFPVLTPVILALGSFLSDGQFRFDYLMPAELALFGLAGGALLVWAALRADLRRALIIWSLAAALVLLVAPQLLASATGMASGEIEPAAWLLGIVIGAIIAYALALAVTGVGGALLVRDLFRR